MWSVLWVGQLLLGVRPCLECGWYTQMPHWEELISLSQQGLIAHNFLSKCGSCVCFPFSALRFLSGLNLGRSCVCCQSLGVPTVISPIMPRRSCLIGALHHLWLLPPPLWHTSLNFLEEGFDKYIPFRVKCSHSAHCPAVGLCVNFYLLSEDVSLMRVKWWTDLDHKNISIKNILYRVYFDNILFHPP